MPNSQARYTNPKSLDMKKALQKAAENALVKVDTSVGRVLSIGDARAIDADPGSTETRESWS